MPAATAATIIATTTTTTTALATGSGGGAIFAPQRADKGIADAAHADDQCDPQWHWGERRSPGGWQHDDADCEQWDRQDDDAWGQWRARQAGRGAHGNGDGWAADWGASSLARAPGGPHKSDAESIPFKAGVARPLHREPLLAAPGHFEQPGSWEALAQGIFRDTHRLADAKYRVNGRHAQRPRHGRQLYAARPFGEALEPRAAFPGGRRRRGSNGPGGSSRGEPVARNGQQPDAAEAQQHWAQVCRSDGSYSGRSLPGRSRTPPSSWRRSRAPPSRALRIRSRGIRDAHGGTRP